MRNIPACNGSGNGYYHFQIFKEDIVFKRRSKAEDIKYPQRDDELESIRGEIKSFSKKSKMRLMHQLRNSQHHFKQFITLTYPKEFPIDGRVVKEHMNTFLTRLRQEYENVQYIWVFEAQTRGAPHYHLILNVELPNIQLQDCHGAYFFSERWSKRWAKITGNEGNPKHIRHGLRIDPIVESEGKKLAFYMAKYYSKNEQKEFKHNFTGIGRYWGASRGFTQPIMQGVYQAVELKWMLKLCFHYANLERMKAGYRRYSYSVDRGCSIWNFKQIFEHKIAPQFSERLNNPFMGLEKPPLVDISSRPVGRGISNNRASRSSVGHPNAWRVG